MKSFPNKQIIMQYFRNKFPVFQIFLCSLTFLSLSSLTGEEKIL